MEAEVGRRDAFVALNMEEGTTGQGTQVPLEATKGKEVDSPLDSRRNQSSEIAFGLLAFRTITD